MRSLLGGARFSTPSVLSGVIIHTHQFFLCIQVIARYLCGIRLAHGMNYTLVTCIRFG